MAGKIIGAVFNLLNAIFLTEWSRWVWLATVMPIQNISGGYLTFIMMTNSFIADNSTNRLRSQVWLVMKSIRNPSIIFTTKFYETSSKVLRFCNLERE